MSSKKNSGGAECVVVTSFHRFVTGPDGKELREPETFIVGETGRRSGNEFKFPRGTVDAETVRAWAEEKGLVRFKDTPSAEAAAEPATS